MTRPPRCRREVPSGAPGRGDPLRREFRAGFTTAVARAETTPRDPSEGIATSVPTRFRSPSRTSRGFALVDICISLVILAIAMGVLVGSVFSAMRISQANEATATANHALRGVLETLSARTIQDVFALCNAEAADDLPGEDPDDTLVLPVELMSDANGEPLSVSVTLPVEDGAPGVLREDLEMPELGLPRDLNGDGAIDAADHSGDCVVLPILLTLEWTGPSGTQKVQMATLLRNP